MKYCMISPLAGRGSNVSSAPIMGESLTDRDLTGISVHTSVLLTIPSLPFTSSHPPMYLVCCMDLLF